MAETQIEYHEHHSYRSSWLAPAPPGMAPTDTSAFEGGADYFGMVDFDSSRRQPFYAHEDSMEDRGTPTNGLYARDGIWDEDEESEVLSSALGEGSSKGRSGASGTVSTGTSRAVSSAAPSTARSSLRMRSRSGTVSSNKGKESEEGEKGMWSWTRRARPSDPPALVGHVAVEKKVKKKESKSLLKGKGRRGELSVQVDPEESSIPPLPSTPASYLQTPNTSSPYIYSPASPAIRDGSENSPAPRSGEDRKGSWKRGVSKLFRSRSSAVLRDITDSNNAPPQSPAIPAKFAHLQSPIDRPGKPLAASTPPMTVIQSHRPAKGAKTRASLAPAFMSPTLPISPASSVSPNSQEDSHQQFGLHPELPADPFASSLTAASDSSPPQTLDDEPLPLPERPKPLRSSSSLQNLKDLFSLNKQPKSPGLTKTKSMAHIKSRMNPTPAREATIPEVSTPTSSSFSGATPRATTPVTQKAAEKEETHASHPTSAPAAPGISPEPIEEVPSMPATKPSPPAESPPLMLPAPPFSRTGSSRVSSLSSTATSPGFYSSSSSSSNGTPQLSINTGLTSASGFPFPSPSTLPPLPASAPTSPLPPLPALPMPSMQALAECAEEGSSPVRSDGSKPTSPLMPRRVVKKSSSHVLLPRSRSTSMSLKSPPTSSSFFDLYEQLGIWPTAEKKEEEEREEREKAQKEKDARKGSAVDDATVEQATENASNIGVVQETVNLDETIPLTSMSASTSGRFSSASWEAAVNAFPDIPDLMEPNSSMDELRSRDPQASEDEHTVFGDTSRVAVRSDSPTTSQTHTAPLSPVLMSRNGSHTQTANNGQSSSSRQTTTTQASGSNQQSSSSYTTYTAGPSRRTGASGVGGDSGGDDDDDDDERWYDSLSHASDSSSEEDEEDEDESSDDVPLSQIHPGAVAAQKARKARYAAAKRDKRTKGKLEQIKLVGRNPGGEHGWNGEGGVPGDVLRMKLEKLSIPSQPAKSPRTISPNASSAYPWAASAGAARAGQDQPRTRVHSSGRERSAPMYNSTAVQDGHVSRRPSAPTLGTTNAYADQSVSRRPSRQAMQAAQAMPPASHLTGYTFEQVQYGGKSPVVPSFDTLAAGPPVSVARSGSRRTSGGNSAAPSAGVSRRPTMTASGRESHGDTPRIPQMPQLAPPTALEPPVSGLGRSNTVSSRKGPTDSRSFSGRKRAVSNAAVHKPLAKEAMPPVPLPHIRGTTEPLRVAEKAEPTAPPASTSAPAPAIPTLKFYVNLAASDNRLVSYPLPIDCTAHDLLAAAARSGDIVPPPGGMNWVVAEIFGELGCERVLREYEEIGTVMRGWEGRKGAEGAGRNSLVIRQEIGEGSLVKAIPQTAPFVGGWAQYENKGKWSKRWLETRGGQVFMAKNEKNKDEVQINTLFGDVYLMTRHIGAPRAFTFVIKRMEPEASFDRRDDWAHIFSMDEGVGYKLMSAIYDAKSFTLRPHLLARQGGQVQRRPTVPSQGPLVELGRQVKKEEKKGPFTGKGLLRL